MICRSVMNSRLQSTTIVASLTVLFVLWSITLDSPTHSGCEPKLELVSQIQAPSGFKEVLFFVGDGQASSIPKGPQWHSQVGQDKTLVKLFQSRTNGYFLDLAANDAIELSNSLTLERDYNWNGVCIEINPEYYQGLSQRKCTVVVAVVGQTSNEVVEFNLRSAFGGIVSKKTDNKKVKPEIARKFSTARLPDILTRVKAPKVIDYMSLDVEGAEEMVMHNFPWDQYTFLCLTVERPGKVLEQALKSHGYKYIMDQGRFGDQFWIHESFPDFDNAVKRVKP